MRPVDEHIKLQLEKTSYLSSTPGSTSDMKEDPKETLLGRFNRKDVLARNANIDISTLAEYERLVHELERAGVDLKRRQPKYGLEHPLGGDRLRLSKWAEPTSSRG